MNKVSIKGVVIGAMTDLFTTVLLLIPLIIYFIYMPTQQGVDLAQLDNQLTAADSSSPLYITLETLCSVLGSTFGGYVAARIAKHNEVLNGTLSSSLSVATSIYLIFLVSSDIPLWQQLLGIPVSIAFAALGGYLRLRQVTAKQLST